MSLVVNSSHDSRDVLLSLMQKLLPVAQIDHIETRPDYAELGELECFVRIRCQKDDLLEALSKLTIERPIERIVIRKEVAATSKQNFVLKSIKVCVFRSLASDSRLRSRSVCSRVSFLDSRMKTCTFSVVKYEPTEDPKHPVFISNMSSFSFSTFQGLRRSKVY